MTVQIISFHCVLKNKLGQIISSTFNQDVITSEKGQGDTLKGLALGLQNLKQGEKRQICLSAQEAYGFYDPTKVIERLIEEIPDSANLRVGDPVVILSSEGRRQLYQVMQILGETVTLDSNHPLAGQDLVFEIEATQVRDATPEDIDDSKKPNISDSYH